MITRFSNLSILREMNWVEIKYCNIVKPNLKTLRRNIIIVRLTVSVFILIVRVLSLTLKEYESKLSDRQKFAFTKWILSPSSSFSFRKDYFSFFRFFGAISFIIWNEWYWKEFQIYKLFHIKDFSTIHLYLPNDSSFLSISFSG